MRIANTATAFPQYYFTQREVVDALRSYWDKGEECAHISGTAPLPDRRGWTVLLSSAGGVPEAGHLGQDERRLDRSRRAAWRTGDRLRSEDRRGWPRRDRRPFLRFCDRSFQPLDRRAAGQQNEAQSKSEAQSDLRTRLRGGSRRSGAGRRLCSRLSRPDCRAFVGRALLLDLAARATPIRPR